MAVTQSRYGRYQRGGGRVEFGTYAPARERRRSHDQEFRLANIRPIPRDSGRAAAVRDDKQRNVDRSNNDDQAKPNPGRALSTHHRVDDELYSEAEKAFGTTGLFDIAALMGQYHTVCTALTLFEVPAPK
jgi:hypothetical protein